MAPGGDPGADLVVQLGRIGPRADPRRVGLHHPDHLVDLERPDPAAGAGAAGDRVRGRDERIAAVIEVEERALGALEQDVVAPGQGVLDQPDRVGQVGPQALAPGHRQRDQRLELELAVAGQEREEGVLVGQDSAEASPERALVDQVLDPQADPQGAVGVGRPDPAMGRADGVTAQACLHRRVLGHVVRQDQVGVPADPDLGRVDPPLGEHVQLGDQGRRVDHHARPDHAADVRVEHARRDEVELEHLVAQDDRVAGVVATLVADGHGHLLGQEVGRLALALVAPLEADDHGGGHQVRPRAAGLARPRTAGRALARA